MARRRKPQKRAKVGAKSKTKQTKLQPPNKQLQEAAKVTDVQNLNVEGKTEAPESKAEVLDGKTEALGDKPEAVDDKTETLKDKTETLKGKTEALDVKNEAFGGKTEVLEGKTEVLEEKTDVHGEETEKTEDKQESICQDVADDHDNCEGKNIEDQSNMVDPPSDDFKGEDKLAEDQLSECQSGEAQALDALSTGGQTTEGYDQEDTEDTDDARTIDMQNEIQTVDDADEAQMADVADSESTTSASTLECLDEELDALDRSRGRWLSTPTSKAKRSITPSPSSTTSSRNSTPHQCGGSRRQSLSPTPSISGVVNPAFPFRPGITWRVGARIEAMDFIEKWYQARIVEINADELEVLIHFEGWNSRYDEWVAMKSDRIRYLPRHSERRDGKKAVPKTDYKIGECVFAKWTDCRHYAARITVINPSGSYEVMFFDGYKKTIQPINIKYMPPEVQVEYANAGLLPPYPKSLKRRSKEQALKAAAGASQNDQPAQPQPTLERKKRCSSLRESLPEKVPKLSTSDIIKETKPVVSGTKRKKSIAGGGGTPAAKRSKMEPSTSEIAPVESGPLPATSLAMKDKKPPGPAVTSDPADPENAGHDLDRDLGITPNSDLSSVSNPETKKTEHAPLLPSDVLPREAPTMEETPLPQVKPETKSRSSSQVKGHGEVTGSPDETEGGSPRMSSGKPIPISPLEGALVTPHIQGATGSVLPSQGFPFATDTRHIKAPKAFKVEADHNQYKCPFDGCPKAFRKESLVEYHIKYYHTDDGRPVLPPPPRKRKKTNSICSTDSEISVGGRSGSTKRRKRLSEVSLGSLPYTTLDRLQLHIEDSVGSDMLEDSLGGNTEIDHHEALVADDSIALGEEAGPLKKDEGVVNCICQLNDENGLMIQCEVCLCWQHASCMELTDETLPKRYVCYVCTNPPGIRDSARFMYVQDWYREGRLSRFNFLPTPEHEEENASRSLSLHDLVGDAHNVNRVLDSLRRKIHILQEKNHPEFHFWTKNWDREIERSRQEAEVVAAQEAAPTASSSNVVVDIKQEPSNQGEGYSAQGQPQIFDPGVIDTTIDCAQEEVSQSGEHAQKAHGDAPTTPAEVSDPGAPPSSTLHDYSMNSKSAPASPQRVECEGDELESDVAVVTSDEDPVASCEKNLLEHIMNMQDQLATRLEMLDQHVTAMEEFDQVRVVQKDVLSDVPVLKKKLHHIVNDLVKVKRMSHFH